MRTASPFFLKYLPAAASIAVGIIPIFILEHWFGVSRKLIVGYGFLAYIIGVTGVKLPVYHILVARFLHKRLSNFWLSVCQGFISAFSELGAAFAFFMLIVPKLSLAQLVGFGAGAGAVEAIMLPFIKNPLRGTPLEEHASELIEKSESKLSIQWMSVPERVWASIIHIATRGLVYLAIITANFIPALIAVCIFAAADGRAYYALLQGWRFDDLHVLGRFHAYLVALALLAAVSFIFFCFLAGEPAFA